MNTTLGLIKKPMNFVGYCKSLELPLNCKKKDSSKIKPLNIVPIIREEDIKLNSRVKLKRAR